MVKDRLSVPDVGASPAAGVTSADESVMPTSSSTTMVVLRDRWRVGLRVPVFLFTVYSTSPIPFSIVRQSWSY